MKSSNIGLNQYLERCDSGYFIQQTRSGRFIVRQEKTGGKEFFSCDTLEAAREALLGYIRDMDKYFRECTQRRQAAEVFEVAFPGLHTLERKWARARNDYYGRMMSYTRILSANKRAADRVSYDAPRGGYERRQAEVLRLEEEVLSGYGLYQRAVTLDREIKDGRFAKDPVAYASALDKAEELEALLERMF